MIVKANFEEAKLIYKNYMESDFPSDEIPDYDNFQKITEQNKHNVYLYKMDNKNVAYFITMENNNNILITHLAVIKEFRSKGIGKIFLEEIKNFFKDKSMLIVEVEAETRANNEEELDIIKRRKKYYLNGDFIQCQNMTYILYGVEYDILIYVPNKEKKYNNYQIKEIIEKIYKAIGINKSKLKIDIN